MLLNWARITTEDTTPAWVNLDQVEFIELHGAGSRLTFANKSRLVVVEAPGKVLALAGKNQDGRAGD